MELLDLLSVLLRHRLAVVLAATLSLLAGVAVVGHVTLSPLSVQSRHEESTFAISRALIAARTSLQPQQQITDTINIRASLLGDLLTTDASTSEIERRAGLRPGTLAVYGPSMGAPTLPVPIAVNATEAAMTPQRPLALLVKVDARLPIVTLQATTADPRTAGRLVAAGLHVLAARASDPTAPGAGLIAQKLGPVESRTVVKGGGKMMGALATIVIFTMSCASIILADGIVRARRRSVPPRRPDLIIE
jgi:hypothetical protein